MVAAVLAVVIAALLAGIGWLVKTVFSGIRTDIADLKDDVRHLTKQLSEIIGEYARVARVTDINNPERRRRFD